MTFEMRCHTIGVDLKFSTSPHQPLFGWGGGGETTSTLTRVNRCYYSFERFNYLPKHYKPMLPMHTLANRLDGIIKYWWKYLIKLYQAPILIQLSWLNLLKWEMLCKHQTGLLLIIHDWFLWFQCTNKFQQSAIIPVFFLLSWFSICSFA